MQLHFWAVSSAATITKGHLCVMVPALSAFVSRFTDRTGGGPGPRYSHAAAILGATMYIHGGRRADNTVLGDFWALDLGTMGWTCLEMQEPHVPPALFSHSLTAVDDCRLLLLGGCPEQESGAWS